VERGQDPVADTLRKARAFRAPWNGKCTSSCPAPLGL